MATKRKLAKPVFRIGMSPISCVIYAGFARGNRWVGKRHEVTQSFFLTMEDWFKAHMGPNPTPDQTHAIMLRNGVHQWVVRVQRLEDGPDEPPPPKPPKKRKKR